MASAPMDALTSFVYLNDHLPAWITKINTLATHVVTKREEFAAEYKRVLEHARPKRKKTPSVTSMQTNDKPQSTKSQKNETNARDILAMHRPTGISPLEPENKYLFANARRGKRRQGTSFRSGASGPQSFRNQHQVIIYYDSFLQDCFEGLVKELGTARNNLRKGKQSRALERGLRLPSFGSRDYARTQQGPVPPSPPKVRLVPDIVTETKPLLTGSSPTDEDASFTEADTKLAAAQALCETAAHQFLRDGDCTFEIDRIREYFQTVMQTAKVQIEQWKREKNGPTQDVTHIEPVVKEERHDKVSAVAEKLGVKITSVINTQTTEIEVDSDDESADEEMVIDISTFRAARMKGLRT
jgi:hypothetical protein